MSPEELTEARETIGSDCQESDLVCAIQEAGQSLLAHIDQQAAQIEALKVKLVEQLAKYFVLQQAQCTFRTPIKGSMMSKCDKGVICDWNVCPIKDEWEEQARQRLAQEMPEVD